MKFLQHPSVRLLGVAVAVGVAFRALFLVLSQWLWRFQAPIAMSDILPWARWAMNDRDGAEAYGLITMALLQIVVTGLGYVLVTRLPPRWGAGMVALLLIGVGVFAYVLPPKPPLREIDPNSWHAWMVVAGALVAALVLAISVRRTTGAPALLAALLFPICFLPSGHISLIDLSCILSPALRLTQGISPREIYMQYDLLPSVLAIAWIKLGGASPTFWFVCGLAYYTMLIGLFLIIRRMFNHPSLAGPLVISILLARMYGSMVDANALPQVTPLRLDLWPILLAVVLGRGLRRWTTGLAVGLLYFFCRGIGVLYIGAYALALLGDFFARRYATPAGERLALLDDLRLSLRETGPALAIIGCAALLVKMVFGRFGSDGVALYHGLGVGMMRIDKTSFYWWLLPLTGGVGWLAFSRRGKGPSKRGETAILAAALLVANSIYFFGRSHEHNLINIGASLLFSLFLAFDLAWPSGESDPLSLRVAFRIAPFMVVAVCAYGYSNRIVKKLDLQQGQLLAHRSIGGPEPPPINCEEIKRAAGDSRILFLSSNDYWYYEQCHLTPRGFIQPLFLNVLKQPLVAEIDRLLDSGVKVAVPRANDFVGSTWPELFPSATQRDVTETSSFIIYRRSVHAQR
jgi:hypothetical protein